MSESKESVLQEVQLLYKKKQEVRRVPMSVQYPILVPAILLVRRVIRSWVDWYKYHNAFAKKEVYIDQGKKVYASRSLLRRRLGSSDPQLQEQKVINLKRALQDIDFVVIKPGEYFSLWHLLGNPSYKRGYVDGMLLSAGSISVGPGGGLCQLANLLHWVLIHSPLTVVERFHHSYDVFPDNGRTLPFGSGATIFYNLIDLRFRNDTVDVWYVRVWMDDVYLHAEMRTDAADKITYKIREREHGFYKINDTVFRYNQLWKVFSTDSAVVNEQRVVTNFAPVMYDTSELEVTIVNVLDKT